MRKPKLTPRKLLKYLSAWIDDYLSDIEIGPPCALVEKDHEKDPRVFAHVFHRDGKICLCRAFSRLPLGHQIGVLLHEIGHIGSDGGEAEADLWVQDNLGIDIDFRNTVQWVDPKQVGL